MSCNVNQIIEGLPIGWLRARDSAITLEPVVETTSPPLKRCKRMIWPCLRTVGYEGPYPAGTRVRQVQEAEWSDLFESDDAGDWSDETEA